MGPTCSLHVLGVTFLHLLFPSLIFLVCSPPGFANVAAVSGCLRTGVPGQRGAREPSAGTQSSDETRSKRLLCYYQTGSHRVSIPPSEQPACGSMGHSFPYSSSSAERTEPPMWRELPEPFSSEGRMTSFTPLPVQPVQG